MRYKTEDGRKLSDDDIMLLSKKGGECLRLIGVTTFRSLCVQLESCHECFHKEGVCQGIFHLALIKCYTTVVFCCFTLTS